MAYGDPAYTIYASGSTGTSADAAHLLYGTSFNALSTLNNDEVVFVHISASAGSFRVWASNVSNNTGIFLDDAATAQRAIWLPPMRAGDASQVFIANGTLGNNASPSWSIWRRLPLSSF